MMNKALLKLCILFFIGTFLIPFIAAQTVILHTSEGDITLKLFPNDAPKTVENFLHYAKEGRYDNVIVHRVVRNAIIQTGGYYLSEGTLSPVPAFEPIVNESRNGVYNAKGTIAMARFDDPDSATSQFFINLKDNIELNATEKTLGYTVFGRVLSGWDVLKKIGTTPVKKQGKHESLPVTPILVKSVEIR